MRAYFYDTKINQLQFLNTTAGRFLHGNKNTKQRFCITAQSRQEADKIFYAKVNQQYELGSISLNCHVTEIDLDVFLPQLKKAGFDFSVISDAVSPQVEKINVKQKQSSNLKTLRQGNQEKLKYTLLGVRDNKKFVKTKEEKVVIESIIQRLDTLDAKTNRKNKKGS